MRSVARSYSQQEACATTGLARRHCNQQKPVDWNKDPRYTGNTMLQHTHRLSAQTRVSKPHRRELQEGAVQAPAVGVDKGDARVQRVEALQARRQRIPANRRSSLACCALRMQVALENTLFADPAPLHCLS